MSKPSRVGLTRVTRFLVLTCAVVFVLLGVLKVLSPVNAKGMDDLDPVFPFLETRFLLYSAGAIEIALGLSILATRAKNRGLLRCFCGFTLSLMAYRIGLYGLAPFSPCKCGGLTRLGLQLARTVPSEFYSSVLILAFVSAMSLLCLDSATKERAIATHDGESRSQCALLPLLFAIVFSPVRDVHAQSEAGMSELASSNVIGGYGRLIISRFGTNGPARKTIAEYSIWLALQGKTLYMTNSFPDGSGERSVLTVSEAAQVDINAPHVQPWLDEKYTGRLQRMAPPGAMAASAFTTKDSHPGVGPAAFVWLTFFGGIQASSKAYLKPPCYEWDSPLAWLTSCKTEFLPSPWGPILRSAEWKVSKTRNDWRRVEAILGRGNAENRTALSNARANKPPFVPETLVANFKLLASTNIEGIILPQICESTAFLEELLPGGGVTNKPTLLQHLEITYKPAESTTIRKMLALGDLVFFRDSRAVTLSGRSNPVFYKLSRLEIVPTNSDIYEAALKHGGPKVQSRWNRIRLRALVISIIGITIFLTVRSLLRTGRLQNKAALTNRIK